MLSVIRKSTLIADNAGYRRKYIERREVERRIAAYA